MVVIQSLYDKERGVSPSPTRTGVNVIQPLVPTTSPLLQRKAEQPQQLQQIQPETGKKKNGIIKGATKFLARTAVGFADLVTESLDFTTKFIVNNPIFNPAERLSLKTTEK